MSVEGLCQICENRTADHQCNRCGALVCQVHYDAETGLCADCASEAAPGDRQGETFQ